MGRFTKQKDRLEYIRSGNTTVAKRKFTSTASQELPSDVQKRDLQAIISKPIRERNDVDLLTQQLIIQITYLPW